MTSLAAAPPPPPPPPAPPMSAPPDDSPMPRSFVPPSADPHSALMESIRSGKQLKVCIRSCKTVYCITTGF